MKIRKLLKELTEYKAPVSLKDFTVRGLTPNSKEVKEGYIFAAIKGNSCDGNKFIGEAVRNGAKAVVFSAGSAQAGYKGIDFIKVKDARLALAMLSAGFYGHPSRRLKAVGVTGTNGKTTITYLLEAILKKQGTPTGVIGTVNCRFKGRLIPSINTTPGAVELQSMLADMRKDGLGYALMEVSSHALDQERVAGINFHSAIFTNLTQDHLDYHKTLNEYFKAKARLFKGLSSSAFAVINNDDKYCARLKRTTKAKIITYGLDKRSDYSAAEIEYGVSHTAFRLIWPRGKRHFRIKLIGRHNLYNALAACAWGAAQGISMRIIKSALEQFSLVPGRLERVSFKGDFSVFVDYAHTEDALKNIINSLRNISAGRIIVVFGCGGERDRTKRPKMGRAVTELADYAIITSDNPRAEPQAQIFEDIKRGIVKDNYCVVEDRYEAIRKSISSALAGDIVLVAGKGHENYQIIGCRRLAFNDRKAVRKCLRLAKY